MKKLAVSSLLVLLLAGWGRAQEYELGEIVITATRTEEEISRIPANVTVITEEEIRNSSATNVAELLEGEVGLVVRDWLGNGKSVNVDLRGFGETSPSNVLVLVDGMRVNPIDISGVDWSQIPIERVERIEIVRGGGAVLYGDNAVGGVINIITRKGGGKPSLTANQEFGSYNYSKSNLLLEGSTESLSYSLSSSTSSQDGYRKNNYLDEKNQGGEFSYKISDFLETFFTFGNHWDSYGMPGALTEKEYHEDRRDSLYPDDYAKTEDAHLIWGLNMTSEKGGNLRVDITTRKRKGYSYNAGTSWGSPWWMYLKKDMKWDGVTPRYTLDKEILAHRNKLTVGFDYWREWYEGRSTFDLGGLWPSHTISTFKPRRENTAWYIYNQTNLTPNLILTLGYRKDRANYVFNYTSRDTIAGTYIRSHQKTREEAEAVQTGLTYTYGDKNSLFLNYSTAFRYPAIDEYFNYFTAQIEDLDIQRSKNYQLGIRHWLRENLKMALTLFYIDTRDELFYNPLGGPYGWGANENYQRTERKGIEIRSKWTPLDRLNLEANYSYTHPLLREGDYRGNRIPGVPLHKGGFKIIYAFNDYLQGNLQGVYLGKRYLISDWNNESSRMKSYWDIDLWLSLEKGNWGIKGGVKNSFNENYAQYGVYSMGEKYYYPSPGRNYYLDISYRREF